MLEEVLDKTNGKKADRVSYIKHLPVIKQPVIVDNILKEINLRERQVSYDWPKKYKYLTPHFFHESLIQECTKAGLPEDIIKKSTSNKPIEHSPILLQPTTTIPKTTSAQIGWRSSRAKCNLEFPGDTWVLPRSFHAKQRFIFLG